MPRKNAAFTFNTHNIKPRTSCVIDCGVIIGGVWRRCILQVRYCCFPQSPIIYNERGRCGFAHTTPTPPCELPLLCLSDASSAASSTSDISDKAINWFEYRALRRRRCCTLFALLVGKLTHDYESLYTPNVDNIKNDPDRTQHEHMIESA